MTRARCTPCLAHVPPSPRSTASSVGTLLLPCVACPDWLEGGLRLPRPRRPRSPSWSPATYTSSPVVALELFRRRNLRASASLLFLTRGLVPPFPPLPRSGPSEEATAAARAVVAVGLAPEERREYHTRLPRRSTPVAGEAPVVGAPGVLPEGSAL